MKFKVKPYPMEGDKRIVRRFAFFPIRLDNDTVVWLETYIVLQKRVRFDFGGSEWLGMQTVSKMEDLN